MPGALPGALITNLLVDRSGLLWVGTSERGLARMDPAGSVFRYVVDHRCDTDPVADNNVHAIFEDAERRSLARHRRDGLKRFDPATNTFDRYGDVIAHAFATAPSKHPDLRVRRAAKNARARSRTRAADPDRQRDRARGHG